jgi:hypothetical protein
LGTLVTGAAQAGETELLRRRVALDAIWQLTHAVDLLKSRCNIDLYDDHHFMDCKGVTIGQAFDDALRESGFPVNIEERRSLAYALNLDKDAYGGYEITGANGPQVLYLINDLKRVVRENSK